jgi:hypothetical protein
VNIPSLLLIKSVDYTVESAITTLKGKPLARWCHALQIFARRTKVRRAIKPEDVPNGKHYGIVLFVKDSYYKPASNEHGYKSSGGSVEYDRTEYWVTEDRGDWEKKISQLEASSERSKYAAFMVSAKAMVKVTVDTKISTTKGK